MDARREARAMVIPLPSFATPQTRFLVATRRDGPDSAHRGVAARLLWRAQRRGPRLSLHPNPGSPAWGVKSDRLLGAAIFRASPNSDAMPTLRSQLARLLPLR